MRRWLPHIGIVVGLSIAIYALLLSSSDEDRIREKLEQLEQAVEVTPGDTNVLVRTARVKKNLSEIFVKEVTFEIPELTTKSSGRDELVALAGTAPQLYRTAIVDLGSLAIEVDSAGVSAVAHGEATLTATRHAGGVERDTRTVSLRFDKIDGDWLIVSASVSGRGGAMGAPDG
jgi:phosphoribosylformylglycinamidine synthase